MQDLNMNMIERVILEDMLRGNHPVLATLRDQLVVSKVAGRDFTGAGFFTRLEVPPSAASLTPPINFAIQDVQAEIAGLERGAGFILFVVKGRLDLLEGYTYGESWPNDPRLVRSYYTRSLQPHGVALVETEERDLSWLFK